MPFLRDHDFIMIRDLVLTFAVDEPFPTAIADIIWFISILGTGFLCSRDFFHIMGDFEFDRCFRTARKVIAVSFICSCYAVFSNSQVCKSI